jgi:hypothetical protein
MLHLNQSHTDVIRVHAVSRLIASQTNLHRHGIMFTNIGEHHEQDSIDESIIRGPALFGSNDLCCAELQPGVGR